MTTRVPQDGEVLRLGTVEKFCEIWYDVSLNILHIQAPTSSTSNTPVNSIDIAAGGKVTFNGRATETQATNKSTGVTLNNRAGAITMNNEALAGAAEVTFIVTNSVVAANDVVIVNHASAGTSGAYLVDANAIGAGVVSVTVSNVSGGSLSEAIVINFLVLGTAT